MAAFLSPTRLLLALMSRVVDGLNVRDGDLGARFHPISCNRTSPEARALMALGEIVAPPGSQGP
jgi:hypothetical protein